MNREDIKSFLILELLSRNLRNEENSLQWGNLRAVGNVPGWAVMGSRDMSAGFTMEPEVRVEEKALKGVDTGPQLVE